MARLPVSGLQTIIRQPTGAEDVILQDAQPADLALALELIGRLVQVEGEGRMDWTGITVSDLEALLLLMRQAILGDSVSTDARCQAADCRARVDVSFRIGEYLRSRKVHMPKNVEKSMQEGWFRLSGEAIEFRLPTVADLLAIDGNAAPLDALSRSCIRPANGKRASRRVERVMEAMAPRYSENLRGHCPECGAPFEAYFDARPFVLGELRNHGASVFQDVHLLALNYNWLEADILALPRNRRRRYADMLRGAEVAA
jgi:hypothetical protein